MSGGARVHSGFVWAALGAGLTLVACWATWALFLAPRSGRGTPEAFVEDLAADLRGGRIERVLGRLAPDFHLDPGGLDRGAVESLLRAEPKDARTSPWISLVHPIPNAPEGRVRVAILGVRCVGDPTENRYARHESFRVEAELIERGGSFEVAWARQVPPR